MYALAQRLAAACTLAVVVSSSQPVHGHGLVHEKIRQLGAQIAEAPKDAELRLARGLLYLNEAHNRQALADFDAALKLSSTLIAAHFQRARALLALGRLPAAEASARRFLRALPAESRGGSVRARCLLGKILASRRRFDAAAEQYASAFQRAASPRPRDVLAWADALASAKRVPEAVRALDAGLAKLGPVVTLQRRALELERIAGRDEAALARLEVLIAESPQPAAWLYEKAQLLKDRGDAAEARRAALEGLHGLDALPASRRHVRAIQRLQARLRTFLQEG